jgi:hypothetical protein
MSTKLRLARQADRDYAERLARAFLALPPDRGGRKDGEFLARRLLDFARDGTFASEFDPGRQAHTTAEIRRLYWQLRLSKPPVPVLEAVRRCAAAAGCDIRTARKALRNSRGETMI